MTRWAPQKADVLATLADEIVQRAGRGRVLVAVDGLAGTAVLADDLAVALERAGHQVFRASIRDFQHPRVLRYPAGSEPLDEPYDYDTLRRVLTDPFTDGGTGSFVLAAFDADRDAPLEPKWMTAKPDALLVVDGTHLQGPALRGLWHYAVWVESGTEPTAAEARYAKQAMPRATAIIDAADPEHPRRVFADSC